jgi:hypothetical protein
LFRGKCWTFYEIDHIHIEDQTSPVVIAHVWPESQAAGKRVFLQLKGTCWMYDANAAPKYQLPAKSATCLNKIAVFHCFDEGASRWHIGVCGSLDLLTQVVTLYIEKQFQWQDLPAVVCQEIPAGRSNSAESQVREPSLLL